MEIRKGGRRRPVYSTLFFDFLPLPQLSLLSHLCSLPCGVHRVTQLLYARESAKLSYTCAVHAHGHVQRVLYGTLHFVYGLSIGRLAHSGARTTGMNGGKKRKVESRYSILAPLKTLMDLLCTHHAFSCLCLCLCLKPQFIV
ncbi:hypothetical protein I7I48_01430 [Histoplasma ohiense]|nr:hypothetical protein I7I48_01430 [Histoplasma ohiense (nom. inval.)]